MIVSNARERIFNRLKQNTLPDSGTVPLYVPEYDWPLEEKISRFCDNIQAVHAQTHRVNRDNWLTQLFSILAQNSVSKLLLSHTTDLSKELLTHCPDGIELLDYQPAVEQWKTELFSKVSAGLTGCKGAIAETGSLILWPTPQEPRLMSLVPPIHIAILDAHQIYDTFAQAVQKQHWRDAMPSNALLISGPSKTADIEQVLAYGVHGPRQLLVIIRE